MLDLSCPDWFAKLKTGRTPLPDNLPLDAAEAEAAVAVFQKLRLPDVPGQPLFRDAAAPWASDFVAAVFGLVVMSEDRTKVVDRPVRKFFQLVPKKNSKTTNGAAIMLTAMLRNRRPNAEFLLVGPTQATAERAYDQAAGMIMADRWLDKRFHRRDHQKTIEDRRTKSKLRIRSFDNKVMTGVKPVGVLIDELHELGKVPYAKKVMAQINGGIIANPEGFVVIITTQSDAPPTGVFETELKHARAVRDGAYVGGQTLPMLYEFPLEMQAAKDQRWQDPKWWPLVLPNLGRPFTIDRLLPEFLEAKDKGFEDFSVWASQHLNVEIGVAINGKAWAGAKYWAGAADRSISLKSLMETCDVIVFGVDAGGVEDLYALAAIGREKGSRRWKLWVKAWMQDDFLTAHPAMASRLEDFVADADLVLCDQADQPIIEIAEIIEQVKDAGLLPEKGAVGVDSRLIGALLDELERRDISIDGGQVAPVVQGRALSDAVWGVEYKLKNGSFVHCGSRLLNWAMSGTAIEQPGKYVMMVKADRVRDRIDPFVAGITAASMMSRNPEASFVDLSDFLKNGLMVA